MQTFVLSASGRNIQKIAQFPFNTLNTDGEKMYKSITPLKLRRC